MNDDGLPLLAPEFQLPRTKGSRIHLLPSSVERRIPDGKAELHLFTNMGLHTHEGMVLPPLFPLFRQTSTTNGRLTAQSPSAFSILS